MDFFLLKSEVYFVLLSPLDAIIKQRYLYKSLKVGILNQYVKVNNLHQLPLPAHDKGKNTHSTAFAVRISPKRTAKSARLIFTR
jgi:hypothetical protein